MSKPRTATILTLSLSLALTLAILDGSEAHAQSCGDTITADTVLASDLVCSGTALFIGADDITLDCNNFSITGDGTGVGIRVVGRTGVTIQRCRVTNFSIGFQLSSSSDNLLLFNSADSNTSGAYGGFVFVGSDNNTIDQNGSYGNTGRGFWFNSSDANLVSNNLASQNGVHGFELTNTSRGNTLESNNSQANRKDGYRLSFSGNTLDSNDGNWNGLHGIRDIASPINTYTLNNCTGNGIAASFPALLC
jgi:parallel beta-helix repeat protein